MTPRMLIGSLALAVAAAAASPAAAQDVTAEVRTWSGQSLQLSQPSLEVFYTIVPKEEGPGGQQLPAAAGYAPGAMGSGTSAGSLVGTEVSGSIRNLNKLFRDKGPEPLQGNRQAVTVTLTQAGVEHRISLDAIKDLAFRRTQVSDSTLPPY